MPLKQNKNSTSTGNSSSLPILIIRPDGSILIRRGTFEQNATVCDLVQSLISKDKLTNFFDRTGNSEIIFGEENLCG